MRCLQTEMEPKSDTTPLPFSLPPLGFTQKEGGRNPCLVSRMSCALRYASYSLRSALFLALCFILCRGVFRVCVALLCVLLRCVFALAVSFTAFCIPLRFMLGSVWIPCYVQCVWMLCCVVFCAGRYFAFPSIVFRELFVLLFVAVCFALRFALRFVSCFVLVFALRLVLRCTALCCVAPSFA